jgi:Zn finger protein HypA/HybF involved in hydrogenase expression
MESDRSFICNPCGKSFKLGFHLKRHQLVCKGQEIVWFSCDLCDAKLKSKMTLNAHKTKCTPGKKYVCSECDEEFVMFTTLKEHRDEVHKKESCEFCDYFGHIKNIKRHIKTVHKGLTPASAARKKTEKTEPKFKCRQCDKIYYDKSTLNRHQLNHCHHCSQSNKVFKSKKVLKEHLVSHEQVPPVKKGKTLSWSSSLEDVKVIPVTKLSSEKRNLRTIFEMFMVTDKIVSLLTNRSQAVTMKIVKDFYEKNSKVDFDELFFRAILSINFEFYNLELHEKEIHIEMAAEKKPVTPSMLRFREQRMRKELEEIIETKAKYIDLVELPMPKKKVYKSAKEVLLANIVDFGNELIEKKESEDKKSKKMKMTLPEIIQKVESRNKIVKERQTRFDQIDWQSKRILELARLVNRIFISQEKSVIMYGALIEKIRYVRGSSQIGCDLDLLIERSNGWLRIFGGWVKRDTSMEINEICDNL